MSTIALPPVGAVVPVGAPVGHSPRTLDAAEFSSRLAARAQAIPAAAENPDVDRQMTSSVIENLTQISQRTKQRWDEVVSPVASSLSPEQMLHRQAEFHLYTIEVEFASAISKQATKTVDQVTHTQ